MTGQLSFGLYTDCVRVNCGLTPLLSLHLLFWNFEFFEHEVFGGFYQSIGTARVKYGVRQIGDVAADPIGVDATATAGPRMCRVQSCAGDVKFEIRVL